MPIRTLPLLVEVGSSKRAKNMIALTIGVILMTFALMNQDGIAAENKEKAKANETPKQQLVFCANQVYFGNSTGLKECQRLCAPHTNDIKEYMNDGWRVISSASKEVLVQEFREGTVPAYRWGGAGQQNYEPARSFSYGCKCIGTEYIIEK